MRCRIGKGFAAALLWSGLVFAEDYSPVTVAPDSRNIANLDPRQNPVILDAQRYGLLPVFSVTVLRSPEFRNALPPGLLDLVFKEVVMRTKQFGVKFPLATSGLIKLVDMMKGLVPGGSCGKMPSRKCKENYYMFTQNVPDDGPTVRPGSRRSGSKLAGSAELTEKEQGAGEGEAALTEKAGGEQE